MPQPEALDTDEPGALQGELAVYLADFDDGTSETRYFLRDANGVEQRLAVTGELDAAPGRKLKIWGKQRGDVLEVARYKVVEDRAGEGVGSQAQNLQPLIDAAQKPGRVMCAAQVNVSGTAKSTVATVKAAFHTGTGSANAYYRENSFGQVGLDGDSYGPFTYSMSSCDYSALASNIKPMLNSQSPVKCDQYAFVFGPQVSACGWAGLGQVGTSDKPATDTWYNDSISCVVAVQEPGHNYGMQHSSLITCSGSAGGFADDPSGCTHSEYGDKYDTMGGGCYHMNAWQKLYQKWFGGCNGVKTTTSGKYNLYPIETACNGVQVLQIPFPGNKTRTFQSTSLTSYYLELRTATGFDSKYGASNVLIHVGGNSILPNTSNPKGLHTWVLQAGGTTWGLAAGKSFSDPAGGLTITVDSIDTTHAVIDLQYTGGTGNPVCLDGGNTPFTPPGPTDCNAPPPPPIDAGTGGTGGTGGKGGAAGTGGAGGKDGGSTGGAAGTGGTGGATGGAAGTGGATGGTGGATGGAAGTGGATGGTGGATGGTGGTAGKGGAAGTGGATGGTGGATGGTGGATGGTGGATGGVGGTGGTTGGNGGKAGSGTGGSVGGNGGSGGRGGSTPPTDDPGCGCRITPEPASNSTTGAMLALGLGALITARRRSRRKSDS